VKIRHDVKVKDVVLCGVDIRKTICSGMRWGRFDLLGAGWYTYTYVIGFVLAVVGLLSLLTTLTVIDADAISDESSDFKAVLGCTVVINVLTLIVFCVFILNVAFHPVSITVCAEAYGLRCVRNRWIKREGL